MKVHYFHEFTCVVEPIWERTNTDLYYFAILQMIDKYLTLNMLRFDELRIKSGILFQIEDPIDTASSFSI